MPFFHTISTAVGNIMIALLMNAKYFHFFIMLAHIFFYNL